MGVKNNSSKSRIEIFDEILNEKYKDTSGELFEINKDRKGRIFRMSRKIVDKRLRYSLYKFDCDEDVFPFFKDRSGIKKVCDYLMFVEESGHFFVLLIELKLGTKSAKQQLDAGECFANFLVSTVDRLNVEFSVNEDCFHVRKIRVSESVSPKETSNRDLEVKENGVIEHFHESSFFIGEYLNF